jgi:hypothetical protein
LSSQSTGEAEIRRTAVPGWPSRSLRDPISMGKKLGMVAYICHLRDAESINRRIAVQAFLGKKY